MKKSLALGLGVLALTACSEVRSPDLCNMLGWCRTKSNVEYINVETQEKVIYNDTMTTSYQGYQLPKRGERYEAANYVITPEVYNVLASRVAGKVLDDMPAILANQPNATVYLAETTQIDRYLPDAPNTVGASVRNILVNSNRLNLVSDPNAADFILESSLTNSNTPETPVISYEMRLFDRAGNMLNSWMDTVRQVQNDDGSWW
ncbi:MAG: hypothetical protein IJ529_01355 [Alphaproteobacteria bacterium]|nr:hypothetical protein [Alphaproteobacteria bacterium]MBQ9234941.1 hypothetical protein [Alphaproteobacteria bacterium]